MDADGAYSQKSKVFAREEHPRAFVEAQLAQDCLSISVIEILELCWCSTVLRLNLLHPAISEATHEDQIAEGNWDQGDVRPHPS